MEENNKPETAQDNPPVNPPPKSKRNWFLYSLIAVTTLVVLAALIALIVDTAGMKAASVLVTLPAATEQQTDTPVPVVAATNTLQPSDGVANCAPFSMLPAADPTNSSLFPEVSEEDWVDGPEDAAVTLVVYSDFQCPICVAFEPVLQQLREAYPDQLRVVFRHYPLVSIHDKAFLAAAASEAAGLQGKFWEMKSLLFETAAETWSPMNPADFEVWLLQEVAGLGLDATQFASDLKSKPVTDKVQNAYDSAASIPIPGTPFLLINGQPYQSARDFANLSLIIELYALEEKQFKDCPPMTVDVTSRYKATILTTKGEIVLELYPEKAPLTVNNFIFLAENHWYEGNPFHRVLDGLLAQSGDPSGTGYGIPGYLFGNEFNDLKYNKAGVVGMASSGPDSNGSQFFITMTELPQLDGKYTIFGQVISGLEVVNSLTVRDPSAGIELPEPDYILSVVIEKE